MLDLGRHRPRKWYWEFVHLGIWPSACRGRSCREWGGGRGGHCPLVRMGKLRPREGAPGVSQAALRPAEAQLLTPLDG